MVRTSYVAMLRRRREGKTDYRLRRRILLSKRPFVVVHFSRKNVAVQIVSPSRDGDKVIASAHSHELMKIGWKGSLKNTPSAYLTGLIAGYKAIRAKVSSAILYLGVRRYVKRSRMSAVVKGLRDSGLTIPADDETLPSEDRIAGSHVSSWARQVEGSKRRSAVFASIGRQLKLDQIGKHFEEVRHTIVKKYGEAS